MPIAVLGLGIVLFIQGVSGSYGLAGIVAAVFMIVQAIAGPGIARFVDRYGQARVMVPIVIIHLAGLLLLILSVYLEWWTGFVFIFAGIAGATVGSVGSLVRSRWSHVVGSPKQLQTAFSWESVADELLFVSGPVLATVMAIGKKIKKTAVVSGVCDGFIGNRMVEQYLRQAFFLLEEGALPEQVDKAIEKFGFAMGPFRMSDLAGNDIGWYIRKRRYAESPELVYSPIPDRLCEQGRFGQKTGAGWYDYQAGERKPLPSALVNDMIAAYSQEAGVARRAISDEEIVQRLVFALTNEGARILEEGIALRASDIDMVYLTGYGFPLHRGGPMLYADTVGLPNVLDTIRKFARGRHGEAWAPAPLLERLANEGKGFND